MGVTQMCTADNYKSQYKDLCTVMFLWWFILKGYIVVACTVVFHYKRTTVCAKKNGLGTGPNARGE